MRIIVNGGGPSGLYLAILARKTLDADVTVFEQNPKDATFGFGIVLADRGMERLRHADEESHDRILESCFVSRHRVVRHMGESIFIEGGGYGAAISRLRLLQILQERAADLGVAVHYQHRNEKLSGSDADLVVGADGVNSVIRNGNAEAFGMTSYALRSKMAWYGTQAHFPYPILSFRKTPLGYFWAVGYAYTETMGTFVAECDPRTWENGFKDLSDDERTAMTEEIFAEELGGKGVVTNKSLWGSLPVTRVKNWSVGNTALIGDALVSAHPSIGSGTRIAMEDSIALCQALQVYPNDIPKALGEFRARHESGKMKIVAAMEKSLNWYEGIGDRLDVLSPTELVMDYLNRTGRISEERLRKEYPSFMEKYGKSWRAYTMEKVG